MSLSVLRKTLSLFDDDILLDTKNKQNHRKTLKKQLFKNKKQHPAKGLAKSCEDSSKKAQTDDKIAKNVAYLKNLSKAVATPTSVEQILQYKKKKSSDELLKNMKKKKKDEATVFTEEDFAKFEKEYFVNK